MKKIRIEKDTLGRVAVPQKAYYGAQTQRAIKNFPVSGLKSHPVFIESIVIIKKAAVFVNHLLGSLDSVKFKAINCACNEILTGKMLDQFIVDPYQAGAGTSLNMNINEVIANRANEILGASLGSYQYIHPNNHVNMSQSTNDVIPTAMRIATLKSLPGLIGKIKTLEKNFSRKAEEFTCILKTGRTHLQDALPITLGQEFSAYYEALKRDRNRIEASVKNLLRIGIGGTAVGTGVNTHLKYHRMMVLELIKLTGLSLKSSDNLFESMQNTADFLEISGSLRILAHTLIRIGNDLRLLSSGPKAGFAEITLPAVQPGSSIMPGKLNPSIVEMLTMVCYQVIGFDQAILLSSSAGQLELNVMLPLIAYNLLEQIRLFTTSIEIFNEKCIRGIHANKEMCQWWLERSSGIAAILNPYLGYQKTAQVVKFALEKNISIKETLLKKNYLSHQQIRKIFNSRILTKPNLPSKS